jgi:hypothetical protein
MWPLRMHDAQAGRFDAHMAQHLLALADEYGALCPRC